MLPRDNHWFGSKSINESVAKNVTKHNILFVLSLVKGLCVCFFFFHSFNSFIRQNTIETCCMINKDHNMTKMSLKISSILMNHSSAFIFLIFQKLSSTHRLVFRLTIIPLVILDNKTQNILKSRR